MFSFCMQLYHVTPVYFADAKRCRTGPAGSTAVQFPMVLLLKGLKVILTLCLLRTVSDHTLWSEPKEE